MWKSGLENVQEMITQAVVFCMKCVGMPLVRFLMRKIGGKNVFSVK